MTYVDFVDHVGLAATFATHLKQTLIGAGRYIVCANDPKHHRAEVAFAVLDEHQGKGIGSFAVAASCDNWKSAGSARVSGRRARGQQAMIGVFKGSGFPIECSTEFGVERVLLTIADGPQATKKCSQA
jgi:hypothetical protein